MNFINKIENICFVDYYLHICYKNVVENFLMKSLKVFLIFHCCFPKKIIPNPFYDFQNNL